MRKFLCYLVLGLIIPAFALEGQTDVSVSRKDFKADKQGFKEAWSHVQKGDSYYKDAGTWYGNAFEEYLQAIVYNNSNAELNYKTGVSALFSDKREEAASFLLKALELKTDVSPDILFLTARALQYDEKFAEALVMLNDYLVTAGKKDQKKITQANKWIEECTSALIIIRDTLNVSIENIGKNINSSADDYSQILTPDGNGIFFASRRELPGSRGRKSDTKFDENILFSSLNGEAWEPAVNAGKEITTKFCETPLFISPEGDKLYIYAGYENEGDIMVSVNKKGEWKYPRDISFPVNSSGSETSFCITPSGNEIYFVTENGKDNFGGKDICYIKKLSERRWSKPQNAGGIINTAYDEESVKFSHAGDTMWFSSKGHGSIGGYDIFYSVRNQSGDWDSVKNIGYPVNTPWDEVFYTPSALNRKFYFVSNRKGGFGGLDIYTGSAVNTDTTRIMVITSAFPDASVAVDSASVSNAPAASVLVIEKEAPDGKIPEQNPVKPDPEIKDPSSENQVKSDGNSEL